VNKIEMAFEGRDDSDEGCDDNVQHGSLRNKRWKREPKRFITKPVRNRNVIYVSESNLVKQTSLRNQIKTRISNLTSRFLFFVQTVIKILLMISFLTTFFGSFCYYSSVYGVTD